VAAYPGELVVMPSDLSISVLAKAQSELDHPPKSPTASIESAFPREARGNAGRQLHRLGKYRRDLLRDTGRK
jgi:hypothetical protein